MMRRELALAALVLAGLATSGSAAEPRLRLAQSVNEQLPGGVEHRPSSSDKALGSARSAAPPRPVAAPPPAATAPAPAAAMPPSDDAKSASKKKKSQKKSAPTRAMPPTLQRAPSSESMPRPGKPDESIPGGVERSPSNSQ